MMVFGFPVRALFEPWQQEARLTGLGIASFAHNDPDKFLIRISEVAEGGRNMLWTLFVILLVLWLLGMVSSYTLGGFIHILLVVAVIILLFRLFSGRTVV